jgi:riboflavin synthase
VFSGIVERVGRVETAERSGGGLRLSIRHRFDREPAPGESVAVNGVCLTAERAAAGRFEVVAVDETLTKTTLGRLTAGARVNLERALRVGDSLGGHWLQGHVDGVGTVRSMRGGAAETRLDVELPPALGRYVAPKGSISLDGISLTVAGWSDPVVTIALIPYTLEHTVASEYRPGTAVNVEVDLIARYLERLLDARGILDVASGRALDAGRNR